MGWRRGIPARRKETGKKNDLLNLTGKGEEKKHAEPKSQNKTTVGSQREVV